MSLFKAIPSFVEIHDFSELCCMSLICITRLTLIHSCANLWAYEKLPVNGSLDYGKKHKDADINSTLPCLLFNVYT